MKDFMGFSLRWVNKIWPDFLIKKTDDLSFEGITAAGRSTGFGFKGFFSLCWVCHGTEEIQLRQFMGGKDDCKDISRMGFSNPDSSRHFRRINCMVPHPVPRTDSTHLA
jgi:hypothetical protein